MTARLALAALAALLALPASAGAHTIDGPRARRARRRARPGARARTPRITADGTQLVLRRDGARVVEVLDLQGAPALKLDANGAWARKGAPILTVLAVDDRRAGSARPARG